MTDIIFTYNDPPKKDVELICCQLGFDKLFGENIACYFTDDTEVISGRQRVYKNISEEKGLRETLERISSNLTDLFYSFEQANIGASSSSNETALNSVCAVNSYISFIENSFEELRYYKFDAEGLKSFFEFIKNEKESEYFKLLKKNAEQTKVNIRNIKSVTVGINLDVNLKTIEMGLVSINTTPYRSGRFIDKLLSASFNEPSEFECLCPLSDMGKALKLDEVSAVNFRLNRALDKLLSKNFKTIAKSTMEYLSSVRRELSEFKKGLNFYLCALKFFDNAQRMGLPVCLPEISKEYHLTDIYNYRIACSKSIAETVPNSLTFDENGRIYLLTGANSGGKSVFLESVAVSQLMFQLGLPVLAREARMFAFNNIHLYLASESFEANNLYGRFENEAKWFSERINQCGEKDLFIMDELFSGTGAIEAAEIAFSALSMIKDKGGYALFSTHLHSLAKRIAEIKEKDVFDNLSIDTQHPYSIIRGTPRSYESKALAIAEKYGIL
ncbi:MAG: hypothetical protein IJB57_11120 [Clostridia bacterium]|nr:hypothetical protein [Clostridia bacterium]